MSEKQLQAAIIECARRLNWRCAHFTAATVRGGRTITPVAADGAGWPDLVLVRDRVLFVEVKRDGQYPKPHQRVWHEALREAGQTVYVWREKDWRSGAIEAALA